MGFVTYASSRAQSFIVYSAAIGFAVDVAGDSERE